MTKQTEKMLRGLGWILGAMAILIALYGIIKSAELI